MSEHRLNFSYPMLVLRNQSYKGLKGKAMMYSVFKLLTRALNMLMLFSLLGNLLLSAPLASASATDNNRTKTPSGRSQAISDTSQSGLLFIENASQFDEHVRFQVRGATGGSMWLTEDALWFTALGPSEAQTQNQEARPSTQSPISTPRRGVNLKLSFAGANPQPRLVPFGRLDTHVSYFIGNNSTQWRTDVPVWSGVRYVDLFPGVDLEVTGENGRLVQRLVVRDVPSFFSPTPGEKWGESIRLRVDGADALTLLSDRLRLTTAIGDFTLPLLQLVAAGDNPLDLPLALPKVDGYEITAPFAPATTTSPSPSTSSARTSPVLAYPLLRPPVSPSQAGTSDLLYATFLEGGINDDDDRGYGIAVDEAGNAYVTGETWSTDFPTTAGVFDTSHNGRRDVFVVKMNADGTALTYATFLGGFDDDAGQAIAVDGTGNAYVTGYTYSSDFIASGVPGFDSEFGGLRDAFVVKLEANGTGLVYASYLGGSGEDTGYAIAVGGAGNAYVTGDTFSADFIPPGVTGFDTSIDVYEDAFVVKVNASGTTLVYATYLGGSDSDIGNGLAVDGTGNAYVTGYTYSTDFIPPGTIGFDTSFGNSFDGFVVKMNANGMGLMYATYLGGSNDDFGESIAVDGGGNAYVTGYTYSTDFIPPGVPGFDTTLGGFTDAFVVKVQAGGTGLAYATYLGGSFVDDGQAIAIDEGGNAYVTGYTSSDDLIPLGVTGFDISYNDTGGGYDAFVVKVQAGGTGLAYATYLGGYQEDYGLAIALDGERNAYITGYTSSPDFIPSGVPGFDTSYDGNNRNVFVAKLALESLSYTISGRVTDADTTPISGVVVSAGAGYSATTEASGYYTITEVVSGTYTLTPTLGGYSFEPITRTLVVTQNVTGQHFTGTLQTYTISGRVTDADTTPISGVVVSAGAGYSATTEASGYYTITEVVSGTYTLTPTLGGYSFEPITRTLVVTQNVTGQHFTGTLQTYTISGQVTDQNTGLAIAGVTVSAGAGHSDVTDVNGLYTIPNLSPGTYRLTPSHSDYYFLSEMVSVPPDATQNFEGTAKNAAPSAPPIPNVGFKGAGWLRFVGGADTNYRDNDIGWNVEMIDHIDPALAAEIENFPDVGVETIVRLDIPGGNNFGPIRLRGLDPAQYETNQTQLNQIVAAGNCAAPEITNWMENLDTFYERFIVNGDPIFAPSITYFILANEPNHMTDEWNYSAGQYAFVYNCYYQHWLNAHFEPGDERRPHALLVAGPGHEAGRPNQWDVFLPELFNGINDSDGFAMHVYGYYTDDADGNMLFKNWLNMIMSNMQNHAADKLLIITEYNPGAAPRVVNAPPHGWADWFERTYCWVKSAQNNYSTVDLIGLIYYVDEPDAERSDTARYPDNDPDPTRRGQIRDWWPVSLRSDGVSDSDVVDDARRQAWLLLDENFDEYTIAPDNTDYQDWCPRAQGMQEQNIGNLYASTGPIMLPLMVPQPLAQTTPSGVSIGGVISGTLGVWGGKQIYYVTEDLEIPLGETLEIEAGTTLVFSPSLQMEVRGQLLARGNTVFPVRFINPDETGWSGIRLYPTASGSRCIGCYLENISAGGTALTIEAPITFQSGLIRDVPDGVAISSTVPLTLSHTVIDYVGTGVHLSGQQAQSYSLSHLTINRCQQGVVNQGQSLNLDNSILTTCSAAISTTLSGITAISYTLFEANTQDFVTQSGSNLLQGPGLLNINAGFVDFPNDVRLRSDSPAANVGDPEADYSYEQGYNGGRADLGAYGNTWRAPQQPPLDQMQVSVTADRLQQSGTPGQVISFTITVRNTGSITDTYFLSTDASWEQNGQIQGKMINNLAPQGQISATLWVNIPLTPTTNLSNTISVVATGDYGVQDELQLTIQITTTAYQEVDGQVALEAERFMFEVEREGQAWITQTVLSDYTGSGYVSILPDIDRRYAADNETAGPQLVYIINFSTPGTYTLWLRGYAPNAAGDSVYVSVDDQPPANLTGFAPRQWEWLAGEAKIEVGQPGLYALHIRQREDGLKLDRILLTTDNTYVPVGNGPGESEIR
jgi:hypothetical protein